MRSAAVLAFSGLAVASYIPPPYDAPAGEVTPSPVYEELPIETAFVTSLITVISCAPEVTDCPAKSTAISTTLIPVSSALPSVYPSVSEELPAPSAPGEEYPAPSAPGEDVPVPSAPSEEAPVPSAPSEEYPVPSYPAEESSAISSALPIPVPPSTVGGAIPTLAISEPALCPSVSVKTVLISTELTTVIPTVITKIETATLEFPCPEETGDVSPSASIPVPPPAVPTYPVPGNGTTPGAPAPSGPAEAGAAGVSGSVFVAAFAAVAAFIFA